MIVNQGEKKPSYYEAIYVLFNYTDGNQCPRSVT